MKDVWEVHCMVRGLRKRKAGVRGISRVSVGIDQRLAHQSHAESLMFTLGPCRPTRPLHNTMNATLFPYFVLLKSNKYSIPRRLLGELQ